jgi:hypothetical protein
LDADHPENGVPIARRFTPWGEQRQVEQDLIISRALVELFNDPFLREQLRFRGGKNQMLRLTAPTARTRQSPGENAPPG